MDIEQLYRDFNITFVTEGHKHARNGWINTPCPFCTGEHEGYHLGYDVHGNKFVCWRCGGKYAPQVLSKLLKVGIRETYEILKKYGILTGAKKTKRKLRKKVFKLPPESLELKNNHRSYLIKRNFDPDKIITEYGILGTGVYSMIDNINYRHRIIIPYSWDGEVISFDSRDITEKSQNKYMACSDDRELIPRKNILYGRQDAWRDVGICVEGATDVWRMGFNSFATSGIKYTPIQVRWMSKLFKKIVVIFDDEPQAIEQANKLVAQLQFRRTVCRANK